MGKIDIKDLLTYQQYADQYTTPEKPLSRSRVIQLIRDKRLKRVEVAGKFFIDKNAKILPSKAVLKRAKKMQQFEKSLRK